MASRSAALAGRRFLFHLTLMTDVPGPIDKAIEAIEEDFSTFSDWEERYAYILDLGRRAPALPDADKIEANKVRGCVSQVWLTTRREGDRMWFFADSDSHLVRGLAALMTGLFSNRTAGEILSVDPAALLARLGFAEALTPQRSNGLLALMRAIRAASSPSPASATPV